MAEPWYCSICGTSFTRAYTCDGRDRHLDNKHDGQGEAVRERDLPISLRSQLAKRKRKRRSQRSNLFRRDHSDNDEPSSRHSYRDSYGWHDTETEDNIFHPETLTKMVNEIWNEWLRNSYRSRLLSQLPNPVTSKIPSFGVPNFRLPPQLDYSKRDVFGYVPYVCAECQTWEPLEVYYTPSSIMLTEQRGHLCPNTKREFGEGYERQALVSPFARKLEKFEMNDNTLIGPALEFLLRRCHVNNKWPQLAAFRVISTNGELLPDGKEKPLISLLPHPTSQKGERILLTCDKNKCITLALPKDPSHWLCRLMEHASTSVLARELREFLSLSQGATFMFVRMPSFDSPEGNEQARAGANTQDQYFLIVFHEGEQTILSQVSMGKNDVAKQPQQVVAPNNNPAEPNTTPEPISTTEENPKARVARYLLAANSTSVFGTMAAAAL